MLVSLRSKGASWVIKTLFGLLIISFAWWGIPDIFRRIQPQPRVASIGDVTITPDELRQAVDREVRRLQQALGGQLDPELVRSALVSQTLDRMVERNLLSVYAADAGVVAPDEILRQRIQNNPDFKNAAGQFDPATFAELLRQNDHSEASYLRLLRQDTINQQIIGGIEAGATAPKALADALFRYRNEQRIAETLVIPETSITDIPQPDDATLEAFHEENAERYQAPEYRGLTIVRIRPEDHTDQVQVSEEDLLAEYETRRAEFDIPERRELQQVVLPDESAAKAAYDKLKQGRTLADVSHELLERDPDAVDLGTGSSVVSQAELAGILGEDGATSIFATPEGQVAAPVKGPLGWHIVQVKEIEPAVRKGLEEVRSQLKRDVALRLAADQLIEIANQLEDELGGGATLTDGARKLGLPIETVAAVDSTGKAPDGGDVADVAGNEQLLSLAFETGEGEDSPMTDAPDGSYVILHVDSIRPAATRPLSEVRDEVVADWQAAERQKAATADAQAIAERVQAGESLGKIASDMNLTTTLSQAFKRDTGDDNAGITGALASRLFELKVGDAATGRNAAGDGEVVAVLKEIKPADLSAASESVSQLRAALDSQIAGDLYAQFSAALRKSIGVSIDQAAIDSLYR